MFASTTQGPVLVIGAAHVVDIASPLRQTIRERTLDGIAVELDADRARALLAPEPSSSASGKGVPIFLRLWSLIQRRLGQQIGGGLAGAEMRTAAELAKEREIPLFLIDDPIRETLARLMRSMSLRERVSLMVGGIVGLFAPSGLVVRQIDRYTDQPDAYLNEIRQVYPTVARVLLDDRNEHMADRLARIRSDGYGRVAVVVGDAHVEGLAGALRRRGIPTETVSFGQLRTVTVPSAGSG
jgi:pheromone shutdown protein TraB